ncbi:MAG TPA: hypothetical protein VGI08_08560 [Diaminobutyricibacter sp.]
MSDQSENSQHKPGEYEYPDEAGYPDGTGTLDEGTASAPSLQDLEEFGAGDEEDV